MLPISWPVSVVLAALLSVIHLSYRIASNLHAFPDLFLEEVSVVSFCVCRARVNPHDAPPFLPLTAHIKLNLNIRSLHPSPLPLY